MGKGERGGGHSMRKDVEGVMGMAAAMCEEGKQGAVELL